MAGYSSMLKSKIKGDSAVYQDSYNNYNAYSEPRKKRAGCLIFILLFFFMIMPILTFGSIIVFIVLPLSNMGPSEEINAAEFQVIAESNNFHVEEVAVDGKKTLLRMAMDGDCVVYFKNNVDGILSQEFKQDEYEDVVGTTFIDTPFRFTSDSFKLYTSTTNDMFYFAAGTENTLVYAAVPVEEKERAIELLSGIDYWVEEPVVFEKLEQFMQSLGEKAGE